MLIKSCKAAIVAGNFRVSSIISDATSERTLWFEVPAAYKEIITLDSMDAFVVGCLLPAMFAGHDVTVEGPISGKLYYNLKHYLMPILKEYLPDLHIIGIKPSALHDPAQPRGSGVLSGFSGGIDSFCNYVDHSGDRVSPEYRITHFVYNNVGSHGQGSAEQDQALFMKRFASIRSFAEQEGKPFITVNSNIDGIIGMDFQLTHTIRNAAVALLMQKGIEKFLYASAYPFNKTQIKPSHDMAYLDPVILPLLGTERLECIASGGQYTRVTKTARVATIEASEKYLDVCVHPRNAKRFINCSYCWKCLRTELTLSILGKLERYNTVFDTEIYWKCENLYLIDVLTSRDPLLLEIADFIKSEHFPVPRMIKILAAITPRLLGKRITQWVIPKIANRNKIPRIINACLSV
jgi:hypothetical protein